jgi:hypothetical protein
MGTGAATMGVHSRERTRGISQLFLAALLVFALLGVHGLAPSKASGAVTGCTSNGIRPIHTCVVAWTGGKDYATKKQWLGQVRAEARGAPPPGGVRKLEVWGDGFYYAKSYPYYTGVVGYTWTVNRWLRSGTYVCAARTDGRGERKVACIAIRV